MSSRRRRGSALIEMACTLPFVATLFVGLSDFAVLFYRLYQLEAVNRSAVAEIWKLREAGPAEVARLRLDTVRDAGVPNLQVALTEQYACPTEQGDESALTEKPTRCAAERTYWKVETRVPMEPMLLPLQATAFPAAAVVRTHIRVR